MTIFQLASNLHINFIYLHIIRPVVAGAGPVAGRYSPGRSLLGSGREKTTGIHGNRV